MPCLFVPPLAPSQGRLVSRYGWRAGIQPPHVPTFHAGIDLGIRGAPIGTVPVYAVAAGLLQIIGRNETHRGPLDGYGNCVGIKHDGPESAGPVWSLSAHMAELSPAVLALAEGAPIAAGTVLGWVGNTNNGKFPGMGPHLHFEMRHAARGGASPLPGAYRVTSIDPAQWLGQRGITFERGVIRVTDPACDPSVLGAVAAL